MSADALVFYIRAPATGEQHLEIARTAILRDLRAAVEEQLGIAMAAQQLSFAGKELSVNDDGETLSDLGLCNESRIDVCIQNNIALKVIADYNGMYGGPAVYRMSFPHDLTLRRLAAAAARGIRYAHVRVSLPESAVPDDEDPLLSHSIHGHQLTATAMLPRSAYRTKLRSVDTLKIQQQTWTSVKEEDLDATLGQLPWTRAGGQLKVSYSYGDRQEEGQLDLTLSCGADGRPDRRVGAQCRSPEHLAAPTPQGHVRVRMSGYRGEFRGDFPAETTLCQIVHHVSPLSPEYHQIPGGYIPPSSDLTLADIGAGAQCDLALHREASAGIVVLNKDPSL